MEKKRGLFQQQMITGLFMINMPRDSLTRNRTRNVTYDAKPGKALLVFPKAENLVVLDKGKLEIRCWRSIDRAFINYKIRYTKKNQREGEREMRGGKRGREKENRVASNKPDFAI
jgi:hypothetical protein